jgi:CO/xanthine dehydrogenase Mo-binding subunit
MYPCENIDFLMEAAYTNFPVGGAYRGYGATQAVFSLECLVDEAAAKLGMDPLELRVKNHIRSGMGSPIFKALGEGTEGVEMTIGSCAWGDALRAEPRPSIGRAHANRRREKARRGAWPS